MDTHRWKRAALLGVGLGLFAFVALKVAPFNSGAEPVPTPYAGALSDHRAAPGHELGQLVGRDYRLIAFTSPEGPRYTVVGPEGKILAVNCTAEDISREFPGLEMETMTADVPTDGRLERQWGE